MRVYTAQDEPVPQLGHEPSHAVAEESRAGAEVLGRHGGLARLVGRADLFANGLDLARELLVGERSRRLVVHGVVTKLAAATHDVGEDVFATGDLASDDEERRRGLVAVEHLEDLLRMLGRRVVDRQGHHLLVGAHFPEHVWPSAREVRDQPRRRLVDDIEWYYEQCKDGQEGQEGRHSAASRPTAELGGQAEEREEETRHRRERRAVRRYGTTTFANVLAGLGATKPPAG